jgi:hypothetical protein
MALTVKQSLAVVALTQGQTQDQAATAAKCSKRTLQRWLFQKEFKSAIAQAKKDSYEQSISRLVALSSGAVVTLATLASDPKVPPAARVAACRTILDAAHRGYAIEQLESRLSQLEEKLKP